MRKLKVYLDTSVISHLLQKDVPNERFQQQKNEEAVYLGNV